MSPPILIKDLKEFSLPSDLKTLERIPNRRDEDYFHLYANAEFKQISWYRRLFTFISRCLYFITGPKFVVPILGMVQYTKKSFYKKVIFLKIQMVTSMLVTDVGDKMCW